MYVNSVVSKRELQCLGGVSYRERMELNMETRLAYSDTEEFQIKNISKYIINSTYLYITLFIFSHALFYKSLCMCVYMYVYVYIYQDMRFLKPTLK